MPSTAPLSQDQRVALTELLQSRLAELKRERESQLQGQSQVAAARRTLLQDADDASQRAGEHEVEGTFSDIESAEFNALSDALKRIHGAGYGLCIDCGGAIPFDRLQLEPQALRCAACQTLHDRQLLR
jgi:RNA polymerase-binding transcription factor DksA